MKKLYVVMIIAVVLLAMAGTFLARSTTVYSAQVIAKDPKAGIGIAPFEDRVDFGDVPAGVTVAKTIFLDNRGDSAQKVKVLIFGQIGGMIRIEPESDISLEAGDSQELKLRLTMPVTASPESKFTGKVIIIRLPGGLW